MLIKFKYSFRHRSPFSLDPLGFCNVFGRLRAASGVPTSGTSLTRYGASFLLASVVGLVAAGCSGARPVFAPADAAGAIDGARSDIAAAAEPGAPSAEEKRLHALLNAYRAAHHLRPVALSRSLSNVARRHATDLARHGVSGECSVHSWSKEGSWTPCCYDLRHPDNKCMWNKPRELTGYEGVGFEIGYQYTAGVRAPLAMRAWQHSAKHESVILNRKSWSGMNWEAVGIGIDGEYATVWWGEDPDPAGYWE